MNELIKKCAKEAGFKTDWQHSDVQAIKLARFEKFAKLIIEECQTAFWSESCRVSDLAYEEYCSNFRKIEEHFKDSNAST
jgi:hypothetical protein